jgi:hypothetical protein
MKDMAVPNAGYRQVNALIPPSLHEAVQNWTGVFGGSKSGAIRWLIAQGIAASCAHDPELQARLCAPIASELEPWRKRG